MQNALEEQGNIMNSFCSTSGQSPCDGSALSANSGNIQIPSDRYNMKNY